MVWHVIVIADLKLHLITIIMTKLIKWIFIIFFLFGVLLGIAAVSSLQNEALVGQQAELTSSERRRVQYFIQQNNPLSIKSGEQTSLEISQQDLNLLLNYVAIKAPGIFKQRINTRVALFKDYADITLSIRLPNNLMGKYINISMQVESLNSGSKTTKPVLELKALKIGNINSPSILASPLANYVHKQLKQSVVEYELIVNSVQSVELQNNKIRVHHVWDKHAVDNIKNRLSTRVISDELREALIAQSASLSKLSHQLGVRPSLNELLKPMFKLAAERSRFKDPITENKAVFITLGAYALNRNIARLISKKYTKQIKRKRIYLKNRYDLSKHLVVSAAITSLANSELAELIGLEKEVSDSQGGSGFSFADLAADHAGIRLAEYSMQNAGSAKDLQNKFLALSYENEYMPDINNLPERLRGRELANNYEDSPLYKKMEKLIKRRIDELPIYN